MRARGEWGARSTPHKSQGKADGNRRVAYFPTRTLCERMGLSYRSQRRRLIDDARLVKHQRPLSVPTVKGLRDMRCIRKEGVSIWFTLVEPSKCAVAETREKLDRFQAELFAAADRFLFGDTSDVTYAEALPTSAPSSGDIISGVLHVGGCPGCGMALCLV